MSIFSRRNSADEEQDREPLIPFGVPKPKAQQAHELGTYLERIEEELKYLNSQKESLERELLFSEGKLSNMTRERNHYAERAAYWQDLCSRVDERLAIVAETLLGWKRDIQGDKFAPKDEVHVELTTLSENPKDYIAETAQHTLTEGKREDSHKAVHEALDDVQAYLNRRNEDDARTPG